MKQDITILQIEELGPEFQARNDARLLATIRAITNRGNHAEVKQKKDGSLTVYEVKKNIVSVK